ncbi:MAG: ROK family protein [Solirubrobacteraceae bacterium]
MPSRLVVGVDIGGTKLAAGVVDAQLQIHQRAQCSMRGLETPALLDRIAGTVEKLASSAPGEVEAVGFGIPSLIDRRTDTSVVAVNLPLADLRFGALMAERLDVPVFFDNDGNLAALAEHRVGAGRGTQQMLFIGLGTGISGGIIINGELYRGWIGSGGELGHMVLDMDGPPCQGNCPNHGCFEALASGTALRREALRVAQQEPDSALGRALRAGRQIDGALVTELAHDGDAAAVSVMELIGTRLGVALASYTNIFNPERIVVGGGVMAAGEMLLRPARAELMKRALPPARDNVTVVAAEFGADAGVVGAAALAFDGLGQRAKLA